MFYSQLSRVYSLWQGGHRPLTPDPSPPTPLPLRGRGEDMVFSVVLHRRALGRGECSKRGDGGVNDRVQDFGGCRTDPSQDGCSLSSLLDSLHDARFLICDLLNSCCGVP
jgi:hypothetical protein